MKRILCSTGALIGRPNGRDYSLLKGLADRLDCDGFEFMMYDDRYDMADEIAEMFAGFSKPFPSFHVDKKVGELISRNEGSDTRDAVGMFVKNCELAKRLGSEKLVLHLWGGPPSDRDIAHNISVYGELQDIADSFGLLLTTENVVCSFRDPTTCLSALLEAYPDAWITFDTKMAEFHGQLAEIYSRRDIWQRVCHLHINDYKGGIKDWSNLETRHLGEGHTDLGSFFAFVRETGYSGDFTTECTSFDKTGKIDIDSMNRDIHIISSSI